MSHIWDFSDMEINKTTLTKSRTCTFGSLAGVGGGEDRARSLMMSQAPSGSFCFFMLCSEEERGKSDRDQC